MLPVKPEVAASCDSAFYSREERAGVGEEGEQMQPLHRRYGLKGEGAVDKNQIEKQRFLLEVRKGDSGKAGTLPYFHLSLICCGLLLWTAMQTVPSLPALWERWRGLSLSLQSNS